MKDFVITLCVMEGIRAAMRLATLADGRMPTATPGPLAFNVAVSIVILVWGSVLLSKSGNNR